MSFWWSPLLGGAALGAPAAPAPTLASGTTAAALSGGSAAFKYTVTIEGCPYILTDATPQQAIDAWYGETGTHYYTQALGGLYVSMDNSQQLDWKNPLTRGGKLMLHVMPDSADTFGKLTHRATADDETVLSSTIDKDAATIPVKSTTGWPSSGELHIGTECIGYTGTTATTFTGAVRGKYAPAIGNVNYGWGQHHRVGEGQLQVVHKPAVTSSPQPTSWPGRWVVVRLHKYDASIPALNSKDDALIVFAGKAVAVTDDPATGATVVEVKHVLDCVSDATLGGRDQWSAKIRNTITLSAGMTFKMTDFYGVTPTTKTANVLTVEDSPVGDNECQSGEYTITEIYQIIVTWLTKERVAGRLSGTYSIGTFSPDDKALHTDIYWRIWDATSSDPTWFVFEGPQLVIARLGFHNDGPTVSTVKGFPMSAVRSGSDHGGVHRSTLSEDPLYLFIALASITQGGINRARLDDEDGTFQDQYETLPSAVKPATAGGNEYGVFMVDGRFLIWGHKDGSFVYDPAVLPDQMGLDTATDVDATNWRIPWLKGHPEYVDIRQVFVIETSLQQFILRTFLSTGTAGYNHATYDSYPYGLCLGIPYELCSGLIASTLAIPHPDKPIAMYVEKTTKFAELIQGELAVRFAFLRWNNADGTLEFQTWRSPTETNTVGTLTEANKAAPAGNLDHHRSVTSMDGSSAYPIIKIQYNRSLKGNTPGGNDGFRDSLSIVDSTALDNAGGEGKTLTLSCLGTFGDFASTGSDIGSLSNNFLALAPYFTQPARISSRSIDQRYFLRNIGDIMLVEDNYARDPDTGERGVSRYGIILRHSWSLGGFTPNGDTPQPQGGDVDVFFLDQNRVATYVPSAMVDDTATNGGYDAGDPFVLTCYAHKYSETSEEVDASRFAADDEIRIVEIDPADPTAPDAWERTIVSVSGNDITIDAALSSPAWDSSKLYRIVYNDYDITTASQHLKTFQADDADYKVQDERVPYEYGIGGADSTFTQSAAADPVELPPNNSYGDGVGRDVAGDIALGRLLNNINSYKTSVSSPLLANAEFDPTPVNFGGRTWWCIQCRPVFLGADILLNDIYRNVAVAPHYASLAGASASVRVTLSRTRPTGDLWLDVDRGSIIASNTWTTTSTTYSTPTPVELSAKVKDGGGLVWLYVEITGAAKCWGLAHLQVTSTRVLYSLVAS